MERVTAAHPGMSLSLSTGKTVTDTPGRVKSRPNPPKYEPDADLPLSFALVATSDSR